MIKTKSKRFGLGLHANLSRAKLAEQTLSKMKSKGKIRLARRKTINVVFKKLKHVAVVFGGAIFVSAIVGFVMFLNYLESLNKKIPNPQTIFPDLPEASEIFDRRALDGEGTKLYRVIGAINSDDFEIKDVPFHVKLAFLAAEDKEFFNHNGFNLVAILRCGIRNISSQENTCGGSTITQQLVKLTTKKNAPTLERKIEELLLALKVEQTYTKEEILGMYLRIAPFGSSIVGLKTASNFYFGVEPKDLSLAQAAVLASIIQNPNLLSPTVPSDQNIERARSDLRKRQEYVLHQLMQNIDKFNSELRKLYNDPEMDSVISKEMIDEAFQVDWVSQLRPPIATDIKAGHFVNFVLKMLQTRNYKNGVEPFTREELQSEGYKIYTTLDYQVQQIAESKVKKGGNDYKYWNVNNAALMTVIPETGEVIAWAGSKSFFGNDEGCDARGQNCAYNPQVDILQSLQEPGSSNKPIGYYMAYKDGLLYPGSLLPDFPIKILDANGKIYEPKNWNNTFQGVFYSAKSALVQSRNIPAIQVIKMVGVQNYINTFREFGYTTVTGQYGEAAILGGVSVLPWEHAQAYTVFANGGEIAYLNPILMIKDKNGNVVYQFKPNKKKVADERAVFLLNETLKNYDGYSDRGRDMAGKTGTTDNSMDAWYIGYSPDFVTLCWAGNNNNSSMDLQRGFPFYVVHPWCKEYFYEIGESPYLSAKRPFTRPGGIIYGGNTCNKDGECIGIEPGFMIEGKIPPIDRKKVKIQVCTDQKHKKARPVDIALGLAVEKEFFYYISPVPSLQGQLDEYITSKHNEKPNEFDLNGGPNEFCDINRNTSGIPGPYFVILSPSEGALLNNTINIKGGVFVDDSSIIDVQFSLNGTSIPGCNVSNPNSFDITCDVSTIAVENGEYTLKVTARDEIGRVKSLERKIIIGSQINSHILFTQVPPSALTYGNNVGASCTSGICDYTIKVSYSGAYILNSVDLYLSKNYVVSKVGTMNKVGSSYEIIWGNTISPPGALSTDKYRFFVVAQTNTGITFESDRTNEITVVN
ncbi:hypothetical protein D6810_00055 [Candidatus Dojkabacteria bacterium]|uniref:peptidoglycan glycosyltransferase n=1 Tax=Candidatus Dojkabacteria bacterium TaxID=2099670 RepID=A0A3M0Z2Q5_9BACT|nr:MAG: hypothetical protein D6810_00055 [Candidatus Dojkabacteria bacterium]